MHADTGRHLEVMEAVVVAVADKEAVTVWKKAEAIVGMREMRVAVKYTVTMVVRAVVAMVEKAAVMALAETAPAMVMVMATAK